MLEQEQEQGQERERAKSEVSNNGIKSKLKPILENSDLAFLVLLNSHKSISHSRIALVYKKFHLRLQLEMFPRSFANINSYLLLLVVASGGFGLLRLIRCWSRGRSRSRGRGRLNQKISNEWDKFKI